MWLVISGICHLVVSVVWFCFIVYDIGIIWYMMSIVDVSIIGIGFVISIGIIVTLFGFGIVISLLWIDELFVTYVLVLLVSICIILSYFYMELLGLSVVSIVNIVRGTYSN
jgi:hypothetical protein